MVDHGAGGAVPPLTASVYGGSFVGLDSADVTLTPDDPGYDPQAAGNPKFTSPYTGGGMGAANTPPAGFFELFLNGSPEDASPAVGLRTARYFSN